MSDHTESSTGHYLPVKDNLNTTHDKHRELIPVLDFSKLGNQNVSIIHEKSLQDDEEYKSDSSKMNSEDIINALNEDSIPEDDEECPQVDAAEHEMLDMSHEEE